MNALGDHDHAAYKNSHTAKQDSAANIFQGTTWSLWRGCGFGFCRIAVAFFVHVRWKQVNFVVIAAVAVVAVGRQSQQPATEQSDPFGTETSQYCKKEKPRKNEDGYNYGRDKESLEIIRAFLFFQTKQQKWCDVGWIIKSRHLVVHCYRFNDGMKNKA